MTMIETVARAICRTQTQDDEGDYWKAFLPEATAAIQAMRDPTDTMKVAGGLRCEEIMFEGKSSGVIFDDMATVFVTMIDAALTEPDEGEQLFRGAGRDEFGDPIHQQKREDEE